MLLGVKNSTATMAIYADVRRTPLYIRFKIYIIKYWLHVCQLQDSMLIKLIMKELDNLGFNTWVTNVRNILAECHASHYIYKECIRREEESN